MQFLAKFLFSSSKMMINFKLTKKITCSSPQIKKQDLNETKYKIISTVTLMHKCRETFSNPGN